MHSVFEPSEGDGGSDAQYDCDVHPTPGFHSAACEPATAAAKARSRRPGRRLLRLHSRPTRPARGPSTPVSSRAIGGALPRMERPASTQNEHVSDTGPGPRRGQVRAPRRTHETLHSLLQAQKAPRHPPRRQPSWDGAPKGRETQRQLLDCSQDEQANSAELQPARQQAVRVSYHDICGVVVPRRGPTREQYPTGAPRRRQRRSDARRVVRRLSLAGRTRSGLEPVLLGHRPVFRRCHEHCANQRARHRPVDRLSAPPAEFDHSPCGVRLSLD